MSILQPNSEIAAEKRKEIDENFKSLQKSMKEAFAKILETLSKFATQWRDRLQKSKVTEVLQPNIDSATTKPKDLVNKVTDSLKPEVAKKEDITPVFVAEYDALPDNQKINYFAVAGIGTLALLKEMYQKNMQEINGPGFYNVSEPMNFKKPEAFEGEHDFAKQLHDHYENISKILPSNYQLNADVLFYDRMMSAYKGEPAKPLYSQLEDKFMTNFGLDIKTLNEELSTIDFGGEKPNELAKLQRMGMIEKDVEKPVETPVKNAETFSEKVEVPEDEKLVDKQKGSAYDPAWSFNKAMEKAEEFEGNNNKANGPSVNGIQATLL